MTENKLPVEFKAKWIAALRSGEYKQGEGELHNPHRDTYCCLGVAGRIAGVSAEDLRRDGFLKKEMSNSIPYCLVNDNGTVSRLIAMNDSEGKSFSEIADYIESNL
jgi:hypothetical protein